MPIVNLGNYYKEEHKNTVTLTNDQVVSARTEANIYRQCIEAGKEHSGYNTNRVIANAEAHLEGVFSLMLGEKKDFDDVTVDDVRKIADRFIVDGKRYPTRGEALNEKNFRNALYEISMLTTAGLSYSHNSPKVGFLDAKNEPLTVYPDTMLPEEPKEVKEPKRPGWFKSVMHKLFNFFSGTFDKYDADVEEYNAYVNAYDIYTEKRNAIENAVNESKKQSVDLWDTAAKELANKENVELNNHRQRDYSIADELRVKANEIAAAEDAINKIMQLDDSISNKADAKAHGINSLAEAINKLTQLDDSAANKADENDHGINDLVEALNTDRQLDDSVANEVRYKQLATTAAIKAAIENNKDLEMQ